MTKSERVAIFGAGGHAKVVAGILRLNGYEIAGFLDGIQKSRKGETYYGSTVLGDERELEGLLAAGIRSIIVAFGNSRARLSCARSLESKGFSLITAVHPSAILAADVALGAGSVVAAGAVIGPSSKIGTNVIVNTQASLDHDCVVRDGAHLGPGSVITGCVDVGECAWIGAGAVVSDHRTIGSDSIVGGGAVVIEDVSQKVVVVGVPARVYRAVT